MIRYTSKIRRGLLLMGAVCSMVMEEEEAPALTQMRKWSRTQHAEFQAACRWVGQETDRTAAGMGQLTPATAGEGVDNGK